jgi:hypothetical protein
MRVRILRGVMADGKSYQAGAEADVSNYTGLLLIDIGKAEKIQPVEISPAVESPNESPVNRMETAPVKRGRKSKQQ